MKRARRVAEPPAGYAVRPRRITRGKIRTVVDTIADRVKSEKAEEIVRLAAKAI